ncbi:MAG: hypothetical protein HZB31_15660 [Nitrospirae bacterium]|nr:hypothetical protein [Nitrospirota bacterium]
METQISNDLPPALKMFACMLDAQSPRVREIYQYAFTLLLLEDDKAQVIERRVIDLREHLTFKTATGDIFTIVKPDVDKETLAHLIDLARDVLREERTKEDGKTEQDAT